MKTLEDLRAFIVSQMEDRTIPDAVSEWAAKNNGKALTVRNTPPGMKIRKQYGMTSLEDSHYGIHAGPVPGYSFLIAHREKNVTIPTVSELREKNPAYYSGLEERNAKRLELMNDAAALRKLFNAHLILADAAEQYHAAVKGFEVVCDYPTATPDYYALRKLAGWIEEK